MKIGNIHKIFTLPSVLLGLLLIGCHHEEKGPTIISGKIINPHDEFVVLKDHQQLNDTIAIEPDGRFYKKYDHLAPGLYTITHPNEYQSIYLTPNDSVVLRLNKKAFDESLAFSGTHAKENNYLIELFIRMEAQDDILWPKYKSLNHVDFKTFSDSLKRNELQRLEQYHKKHHIDPCFYGQIEQIISFMTAAKLERYTYAHYGKNNYLKSLEIPSSFYKHRNRLPIDDITMLNNYAYRPYANALISSLSFKRNAQQLGSGKEVNTRGLSYNSNRLQVIDSLFTTPAIKDMYASFTAVNFISNSKNSKDIVQLVQLFDQIAVQEQTKQEIHRVAATYIELEPGNKIPDIKLLSTTKQEHLLSQRLNELSVLFFWSGEDTEYALRIHERIKELRVKYPSIDFIGINIDDTASNRWMLANDRYEFDPNQEFQIINTSSVMKQLALRERNRSMVIDHNLEIIDPSINLFHYQIENTLVGYLNR